jgi:hypothetical protein
MNDDAHVVQRIRGAMARLGQPVADLSDAELRRRAQAVTGGRPDGLEQVARALEEPDAEDEPELGGDAAIRGGRLRRLGSAAVSRSGRGVLRGPARVARADETCPRCAHGRGREARHVAGVSSIGAPGFEPGTSPTRTVRATRLRHAPKRDRF